MREQKFNIVWFKKDLRAFDHAPLARATQTRPTLGVFIIEPEWLSSPEFDSSHYVFLEQSLRDLTQALRTLGIPLLVRVGEAIEVLSTIHETFGIQGLFSHEETGLLWTYQRDIRVKKWTRANGIPWQEFRQFGVIRALQNRDSWLRLRDSTLLRPLIAPQGQTWPQALALQEPLIPTLRELNLPPSEKIHAQKGGRLQAEKCLSSFLAHRSQKYSASISSPTQSASGCSRLSPYLTWGTLSISEVLAKLQIKKQSLGHSPNDRWWVRNLESFESRLAWHCHFIQKFESEPEIEFHNMNRSFDGMRETEFSEEYFEAWCKGETGFPMIDASMRSLKVNGWINFRMRAALLSFASYQLWLHWRRPAQFLAKHFLDFEPGIHYCQAQMQSGVTGINTIRIYSPKKQALDQDPKGEFIRKHCPELKDLSTEDLPEPHLTPPLLAASMGFESGRNYPKPIVDPEDSYQSAKLRIFEWMKNPSVRAEAKKVYEKHGSRKSTGTGKRVAP